MQAIPAEITVSLTGPFVAHIPVDDDPLVKAHVSSAQFREQVALRAGEFGVKSSDLNWDGELVFNPHLRSNNMTWKTWRQIATATNVEPQVIIPVKPATTIASPPPDVLSTLNALTEANKQQETFMLVLQRRIDDQEAVNKSQEAVNKRQEAVNNSQKDEIGGLRATVERLDGDNKELRATNKNLLETVGRLQAERQDYDKLNAKFTSLAEKLHTQATLHSEELKVLDDKIKTQAKTIGFLMTRARDICLRGMLERCRAELTAALPKRDTDELKAAWLERATTDPFVVWVFDHYQAVSKRIHEYCPGPEEAEEALKSLSQSDKDKYKDMHDRLFDYLYPGCRK